MSHVHVMDLYRRIGSVWQGLSQTMAVRAQVYTREARRRARLISEKEACVSYTHRVARSHAGQRNLVCCNRSACNMDAHSVLLGEAESCTVPAHGSLSMGSAKSGASAHRSCLPAKIAANATAAASRSLRSSAAGQLASSQTKLTGERAQLSLRYRR